MLARDGATVLIDSISLEYMGGSQIDFVDDLMGQSFQIRNPHAQSHPAAAAPASRSRGGASPHLLPSLPDLIRSMHARATEWMPGQDGVSR